MYQAAFGQKPDAEGWQFWTNALLKDTGFAFTDLVQSIVVSQAFLTRFSNHTGRSEFINLLYENILGRNPDAEGQIFWICGFKSGRGGTSNVTLSRQCGMLGLP